MTTTYELIESRADYQVEELALLGSINTALTVTGITVTDVAAEASLASIDAKTIYVDTNNVTVIASALPTGAATEAKQDTGNNYLLSIDSKMNSLGQKTKALSMPVVLASNSDPLPVTQSGTWTVYLATESIEIGTVDQGTPAAYTDRWPVQIADSSGHLSGVSANGAVWTIAVDGNGHTQVLAATGEVLANLRDASGHTLNIQTTGALDSNTAMIAGTATATGNGASNAGTQRVTIANDSTGTISISKTALTPSSPTAATVGVTSAQVVATNSSRKGLILVNTSVNTISIGLGTTAVLNSGITLYPGGTFQMDEFCYTTGAVNAIASAASSNLSIQEYT